MASKPVQLSDKFLVEEEMHFDNYNKICTNKSVVNCIDQNNGSYTNGIVTIDTTNQLGGNNGFAAIKEGYIIVPYVVSVKNTGSTTTDGLCNALSASLKCNVGNILDRADIIINGKSVAAGQPYTNMWNNIRLQYDTATSFTSKNAGTNLCYPDDPFATFSTSASAYGDGFSNNQINPTVNYNTSATASPYPFNSGAFKRTMEAVSVGGANSFTWPTQTSTYSTQNYANNGKSYFVPGTTKTQNSILGTWYFFAKIMLVDIHPVFETLDLTKNPQIRLTLYFNQGYNTLTATASTGITVYSLNSATSVQGGNTCPVMWNANPNSAIMTTSTNSTTLRLAYGVVNNQDVTSGTNIPFNTTRLYMPFYTLVPEIERKLIEAPVKKKVYNDCYIQQFINAASTNGAPFTLSVQSTLPNIQYVAVVPFLSQKIVSGSNFANVTGVDQFKSPFDSAPWTSAYGAGLYNLQVQIGSQNIYNNLLSYDWQNFIDELENIFAVDGSNERCIGNGLIDQIKWAYGNKLWLFDCSRISSDVRQNVNIMANLQCDCALDFYVIIVYRRSFDLNRITCEVTNQIN